MLHQRPVPSKVASQQARSAVNVDWMPLVLYFNPCESAQPMSPVAKHGR
jgi:hypothetical protein